MAVVEDVTEDDWVFWEVVVGMVEDEGVVDAVVVVVVVVDVVVVVVVVGVTVSANTADSLWPPPLPVTVIV